MVIHVRVFGADAELVGAEAVPVSMKSGATCGQLLDELKRLHPQLTGRIALNHAFAAVDQPIAQHDEVALIGLVSGG